MSSRRTLMVDLFGVGPLANLFDTLTKAELAELVVDLELQRGGLDVHPLDLAALDCKSMVRNLLDRLEALRLRRDAEEG